MYRPTQLHGFALVASALLIASALPLGSDATTLTHAAPVPAAAQTWEVSVVDTEADYTTWGFDPPTVTIAAGDTVRWINRGRIDHNIWLKDQSFNSEIMHTGDSVEHPFTTPGTYPYLCGLHPSMSGVVIVE